MNELTRPLQQIELEINFYKDQTATGIIEVGKRLIEAKQQLTHGEWIPWLSKQVKFSERTAQYFMQASIEFGENPQAIADLGTTKVFILLDKFDTQDKREEFINTTHTVSGEEKTVDEMTTRELQQVIKERDKLQNELTSANGTIEYQKGIITQKESSIQNLANREPVVIEKVVETEKVPEDYEKTRKELEVYKLSSIKLSEAYNKIIKDKQSLEKELGSLKKVNEAVGEYDNKIIESSLFFISKVHNFIEQVGGLAWVAGEVNKLPENERKAYLKAIQLVKDWSMAVSYQIDMELGKYIESEGL